MAAHGYVDQFAYSATLGGWLVAGWIPVTRQLAQSLPTRALKADVDADPAWQGLAGTVAFFDRTDLKTGGVGVFCLLAGPASRAEPFRQVTLRFGAQAFRMDWIAATALLREQEMIQRGRTLLANGFGAQLASLAGQLVIDAFTGQNTFESLPDFVRIGIDEVIPCGPDGAVVLGWLLAWPDAIAAHALCTQAGVFPIHPGSIVQTDRPDILESTGRGWGFDDRRCGFIAFVPGVRQVEGPCWFRVQTAEGRVGYAVTPARRLRGMRAIRRILDVVILQDDEVRSAFDRAIGPACQTLNAARLASPPDIAPAQFGAQTPSPRISLVVPLYGRLDYLEHQLATFALTPPGRSWEAIYVLDDPAQRREALALAESAFARFQLPFQLLLMAENRGFAPACNVGLRAAQGEFVCFLNSDVLPVTPGFLDRMADQVGKTADMVGAVLLFEDGSVQHEGMVMQPIRRWGDLRFPIHPRKGWRPRAETGVERCEMVTGACMTLRRDLADRMGGFDEGFIIGDFEDADLCTRLREAGHSVAVDHGVRLFHFERQSQPEPDKRWRNRVTLLNAWLYDQRHPEPVPG